MPYTMHKQPNGLYTVRSPHGVKGRNMTKGKAQAQMRLLRAIEHNPDFKPRGKARLRRKKK